MRTTRIAGSILGLGLSAVLVLVLGGCASPSDKDAGPVIRVNGAEPRRSLIPADADDVGGERIVETLFAGLITVSSDGVAISDAAASIVPNLDFTTYTITVAPQRTFTNGEKVTAASFVRAWDWAADAANATADRSVFADIVGFVSDDATTDAIERSSLIDEGGLVVVDKDTFEVHLKKPLADFTMHLGASAFFPLPSVFFDNPAKFGDNPIGNGPYKLDDRDPWQHGEKLTVTANPDYVGPRIAKNAGLQFVFAASGDDAYADLLGGYLDVLDTVPPAAVKDFSDELGDRAIIQPLAAVVSLGISQRLDHFAGAEGRLRREAISHAIDRDAIAKPELESVAHDFTSPIIPGYSSDLKGADVLTYDARAAQDLWAEADEISPWKGTFTIIYRSGLPGVTDLVSSISRVLKIKVAALPIATDSSFAAAISDPKAPTAFVSDHRAAYPDARAFLAQFSSSAASGGSLAYSNTEVDDLLDKAAKTSGTEDAVNLYSRVQEQLLVDLPVIPLWHPMVRAGYGHDVHNVQVDWRGIPLYQRITAAE